MSRLVFAPWRDLQRLQSEVNRVLADQFGWMERGARTGHPAFNMWQNESGVLLTAELPGMSLDSLDLTVTRDTVTIRGERTAEPLPEGHTWTRKERPEGTFSRTVELPVAVDPESADASYEKGVLTIRLQRPQEHRPKKVAVRAG